MRNTKVVIRFTVLMLICLSTLARCTLAFGVEQNRDGSAPALAHKVQWLTLKAPTFSFQGLPAINEIGGADAAKLEAGDGDLLRVTYPPAELPGGGRLEIETQLQWSGQESVWRKWARYRIVGTESPVGRLVLTRVRLDEIEVPPPDRIWIGAIPPTTSEAVEKPKLASANEGGPSYPVFFTRGFAGIEFPVAATRIDGTQIVLEHQPGIAIVPNKWYETRRAVCGICPAGREVQAFESYLDSHRPPPRGLHINYNSWWTTPLPFSEQDVLKLMAVFDEQLYRPYGVSFDSFGLDLGWSDAHSIWRIDAQRFPKGFARIQQAATTMGAHLGLWISPSSCYSGAPGAPDGRWALQQGYEFFSLNRSDPPARQYACLGGTRYQSAIRDSLVDLVTRYDIHHLKLDGYRPTCPESTHGHPPGALSAEMIAAGTIDMLHAVRKAAPEIWMESTCFGWNPSPWWLFEVNSVIGTFGDDAPTGRVPAPVYHESYTTARDYFNLQGAALLPIPAAAQEVLGIIHQAPEPFLNDAVMSIMRGNQFMSVYLNPKYMDDRRWKTLAELLKWARSNVDLLGKTEPLLPVSWQNGKVPHFTGAEYMPREPYGYAHWKGQCGLLVLRNPWMLPQRYTVPIADRAAASSTPVHAVSLYPEVRLYGTLGKDDRSIEIPLAPYETIVLSISPEPLPIPLEPWNAETASKEIKIHTLKRDLHTVQYERPKLQGLFGPDWTLAIDPEQPAAELQLTAVVSIAPPMASEIHVLLEGPTQPSLPYCRLLIDGREVTPRYHGSNTGWSATTIRSPEHWLFVSTDLGAGRHRIEAKLVFAAGQQIRASSWIQTVREGHPAPREFPNALPSPEGISTYAVALLDPTDLDHLGGRQVKRPVPVERIKGSYLDALQPESATQGWGTLQTNKSVAGHPLSIAGTPYRRGIGTHAPARIRYNLGGRFHRFQCWAGLDTAATGSITMEVLLDGKSAWQSGIIRAGASARRVDLDTTHDNILELYVTDGGDNHISDHADWADAKLLR